MSMGRAWPSLMAVLLLSLSTACAHAGRGTRLHLSINVAADANDNRPIPVDLVIVWDKKKAAQFGELAAKDWFARKAQLRRDDPDSKAFAVREWEWVPGQSVPAIDVAVPTSALRWVRAVYVFANYRSEGPHRLSVTPGTAATLHLLRQTIQLQSDSANQRHTGAP
jgi:type VI secretion system protein